MIEIVVPTISLESLKFSSASATPILNNFWVVHREHSLVPFIAGLKPWSSIKDILIDDVGIYYGVDYNVVRVTSAYLPRQLINKRKSL